MNNSLHLPTLNINQGVLVAVTGEGNLDNDNAASSEGTNQQGETNNGNNLMNDVNLHKTIETEIKTQIAQFKPEIQTKIDDASNIAGINTSYFAIGGIVLAVVTFIVCLIIKSGAQSKIDELTANLKERNKEISHLGSVINNLENDKINKLESKIKSLEQKIKSLENNQPVHPSQPAATITMQKSNNNYNPPQVIRREPTSPTLMDKCTDFISAFNALSNKSAGESITAREEFAKKFKLKSFICDNSEMLINNPNLNPVFAEESFDGDYWAYEVEPNTFAVVPNVTTYTEDLHIARAMGKVFDSNFVVGRNYSVIRVTKPAIFKGMWNLETRGRLELN